MACSGGEPAPDDGKHSTPVPTPTPVPTTEPDPLVVTVRPSVYTPAAAVAEWTSSGGEAVLAVGPVGGTLEDHASRDVTAGAAKLPITLLPAGDYEIEVREIFDGVVRRSPRVAVTVPPAPVADGDLLVNEAGSEVAGGYVVAHLYAPSGRPSEGRAVVFDGEGRVVWWLPPDPGDLRVIRARPTADGRALLVIQDHATGDDFVDLVALDGESRIRTFAPQASHDVTELPSGELAWLSFALHPDEMPEYPGVQVATDTVWRGLPGTKSPTRVWSFVDGYGVAPFKPCSHSTPGGFVANAVEWTHSNSLLQDPGGDGYWVLARFLDAVVRVDASGAVVWELGGDQASLEPVGVTPFLHGHASHLWRELDGDHLLLFDNQTHAPAPVVSRVVELVVDPVAGTWTEVWSLPDPLGRVTGFLGDARRLDGGNTLVAWTPYQEIVEYTPSGQERWKLRAPAQVGRVTFRDELRP